MKAKTEKAYQEWIEEQTAKLPQELQSNFKQLVESPHGVEVFGGYMREQEFHRRLTELDARGKKLGEDQSSLEGARQSLANDAARLQHWYQEQAPKVEKTASENARLSRERDALRAQIADLGLDPVTAPSTPGGPVKQSSDEVKNDIAQLRAQLAAMDASFPVVLKDLATVLTRASRENFTIDPDALIDHATKQTNNLVQSYEQLTAPERVKREQERVAAEIEKARQEGVREGLSKVHSPERLRPAGPSVFDQINAEPTESRSRVGNAVEAYNKYIAEQR